MSEPNLAQQIFLLFYSILFGIMLGSLPPGSFPTDTMFSTREYQDSKWKKTGKFWNRSKKRFLLSFLGVNVLPSIYFVVVLLILGRIDVELGFYPSSFFWLFFIPLLALAPFGFYRVYAAILFFLREKVVDMTPQYTTYLKGRYIDSPLRHLLGTLFYFWPFILFALHFYPVMTLLAVAILEIISFAIILIRHLKGKNEP